MNTSVPFEQIKHYSKPVVTKAIEAKDTRDMGKLIEALRELTKGDQTIIAELNQETGEHLVSGMGELHLEVIETKIRDEFKVPITTSEPIVVYKETITGVAKDVEGKSPNRHTKFYINVSPLEPGIDWSSHCRYYLRRPSVNRIFMDGRIHYLHLYPGAFLPCKRAVLDCLIESLYAELHYLIEVLDTLCRIY